MNTFGSNQRLFLRLLFENTMVHTQLKQKPIPLALRVLRSQRGVSLIEIIVVMIFIGILAGVAMPLILSWLPDVRLKSASRDLFTQMQKVRMLAIKENKDWAIVFDTANNRYYICDGQGADSSWSSATDLTGTGDNNIVERVDLTTYQHGISYGHGAATTNATTGGGAFPATEVSFPNSVIIFNPRGTVSQAGFVYLDHQGNTNTYAVGALTSGSVRIRRWHGGAGPEPWK